MREDAFRRAGGILSEGESLPFADVLAVRLLAVLRVRAEARPPAFPDKNVFPAAAAWIFFSNFAAMKHLTVLLAFVLLCSCGGRKAGKDTFTVEVMNRMTPVKDQGRSSLCWVYAMLATIETDRLMMGDSVNLSAAYVARRMLEEHAERRYLTRGASDVTTHGVAPQIFPLLASYGVMPYESYRAECNFDVLCRKLRAVCDNASVRRTGVAALRGDVACVLDNDIRPVPPRVWMAGAEYTPQEFARSVCADGGYIALTSCTHRPFYEDIVLDVPDNRRGCTFYNVPLDTMMSRIERALRSGRGVCWEGDISEPGFSFERGVACLSGEETDATQETRQRGFETFRTTDDHSMALVGIARDGRGRRYFVCKNSWGTGNPYGGLMYMSFGYARLKTIAVVMKR